MEELLEVLLKLAIFSCSRDDVLPESENKLSSSPSASAESSLRIMSKLDDFDELSLDRANPGRK